ncbi:4a-hydroxytetrahydrobiopterin dehydratase [Candidatus Uhrbacteria bacterium]|nr:4a-hydroxytetrahydrobiopterin dehydratase [Candidatus Uhrbacteria bacterium]
MSSLHIDAIQPLAPGIQPIDRKTAIMLAIEAGGWTISPDTSTVSKEYKAENFAAALNLVNLIGSLALAQKYYPEIQLNGTTVKISITSPEIKGLSRNDFILAAKITRLI